MILSKAAFSATTETTVDPIPQLRTVGSATQLYVQGKPFLILGGELGNSTASDLNLLEAAFEKLEAMHLNTVLVPVYWDRIEPQEGKFDFTLPQGAIERARAHGLHLVFLWFGTWKNSMSSYAPSWVKRDTNRFERARQTSGEPMEIISPASENALGADARAFSALMRWIRDFDGGRQTVIMVQVENEIGMIPEPRDHSPKSEAAYRAQVPGELMSNLKTGNMGSELAAIWENAGRKSSGAWEQVCGPSPQGQEIFTAWQFASYVQNVARAGKAEYPLPMYVNAALIRPGYVPGQYPSGGPLPHLLELWRTTAPSLDMLSPDVYFPNFSQWCARYLRSANPLFVPEMAPSARAMANAVYAAANLRAIGFCPFAIENFNPQKQAQTAACYRLLAGISPLILKCQQQGTILGLSPHPEFDWSLPDQPERGQLGGVIFDAHFDRPPSEGSVQPTTLPTLGPGRWEAPPGTPDGAAMVLQTADEEFLIVGKGVTITFAPADGKGKVGIDNVQEGRYEPDGTWIAGRWLNGDETHQGRHVYLDDGTWSMQRVKLYRYE